MKMQAKMLALCGAMVVAGAADAQYMAESQAALNMSNTLNTQMPGGPAPVPGQLPGVAAPGAGFAPGQMGGNTMPGMDPTMTGMDAGMMGMDPTMMAGQQAYQMPQATPIPTENVLTGRRVFDAVSGALLEDPVEIAVRQGDAEAYPDDGVADNGIAGDGIRGNVETSKNEYIGSFSNTMKSYLIHAVRNAEDIDPMVYYGYHVAKLAPPVEGLKRYGLPLPGEQEVAEMPRVVPDLPNVLDLEDDRDELVRQWNHEFLANYRVNPDDPQSEYYPVFVPSPPLTPVNYPVPNGYVSPQAVALNTIGAAEQAAIAAKAQEAAAPSTGGMSGGVDVMGGGGI